MLIHHRILCGAVIFVLIAGPIGRAVCQQAPPPADAAVDQAKGAFDKAFNDYKEAMRQIEKMRIDFQTADAATREKLNNDLAAHVAHAQTLVNAMVDAGLEVYRLAPKANPQVTELLVGVARYYAIGEQVGPDIGQYVPIDGGDQYERALRIIKRLDEGHIDNGDVYVWGFLSAFCTNDYDLAQKFFKNSQDSGALNRLAKEAGDEANRQAGRARVVYESVMKYSNAIDKYRELWAKESALRKAEAAADNLPRVRLTTTKGVITIELFENEAPQSVANFLTLVKQGYYTNSPFHRVLPEFMAQGGAKTDEGGGGPGYTIKGEHVLPNYRHHFRGSLSMARKGGQPDSGSSQFFLTFVPTTHLDGEHAVFGRVIEGIEVLGDLQKRSPADQQSPPPADRILKAEVLRDRGHAYKFEKLKE